MIPRSVLAVGLEGTLVSNAVSQIPRPGLFAFLEECATRFDRIVVFSGTTEAKFRHLAWELAARGEAPEWLVSAEFVAWSGPYKRMRFVPGAVPGRYVLLDARAEAVPPDERGHWVRIEPFDYPYPEDDDALVAAARELARRGAEVG